MLGQPTEVVPKISHTSKNMISVLKFSLLHGSWIIILTLIPHQMSEKRHSYTRMWYMCNQKIVINHPRWVLAMMIRIKRRSCITSMAKLKLCISWDQWIHYKTSTPKYRNSGERKRIIRNWRSKRPKNRSSMHRLTSSWANQLWVLRW